MEPTRRATQGPLTWPVGKEGWLNKQSEGMLGKKWQKRWFVINDNDLRYRCATHHLSASICICISLHGYLYLYLAQSFKNTHLHTHTNTHTHTHTHTNTATYRNRRLGECFTWTMSLTCRLPLRGPSLSRCSKYSISLTYDFDGI